MDDDEDKSTRDASLGASDSNKYAVAGKRRSNSSDDQVVRQTSFLDHMHLPEHWTTIDLTHLKFHKPNMSDLADDFHELEAHMQRTFRAASWCFDSSLGNFPIGGLIGLGITITSCMFTSAAMVQISRTAGKYDESGIVTRYIGYYVFSSILFISVHGAVFLHGLSTGILETQRECCGAKMGEGGPGCRCCCCQRSSPCACCCKYLEKFAQRSCQFIWAIVGTVLLIAIYIIGLALLLVSTATTGLSYAMSYSCIVFSEVVAKYMLTVKDYIVIARSALGKTDATMREVLQKYQQWNNIQNQFSDSGVGQIAKAGGVGESSFISTDSENSKFSGIPKKHRMLMSPRGRLLFDPEEEIRAGRSIISALNETIFQSEAQLVYYEQQYKIVEEYCFDFAALYNAFFYVLIAALCLLMSELIVFAVHTKYFSAWNYEVLLMQQASESKKKMALLNSGLHHEQHGSTAHPSDLSDHDGRATNIRIDASTTTAKVYPTTADANVDERS